MAEFDVPVLEEQSPPQFELDQSDDYSRYLLHSRTEILAILRNLIQKGSLITVYFDLGRSFLLTSMVALSENNAEFMLDNGSNDEMNRKALLAERLILTTVLDKVKVQFRISRVRSATHAGHPVFVAAVPESLLRLQRREYFRLATPIANPIRMTAAMERPDGNPIHLDLPLLDISGGGVGLMASVDQAQYFERGDLLPECRIVLPNEGMLVASLSVRNLFDVTTRTGAKHVRVGCEFADLPSARLSMVERYITRVERERKARLNGLA